MLFITVPVNAANIQEKTIKQYEDDVTGDGKKELILLKGLPISADSNFYQKIWIEIKTDQNKHFTIQYKGGYEPTLYLINLTHGKKKDILFQASNTDQKSRQNKYYLHTVQNNKIKQRKLPEQPYTRGKFLDHFFAEIQFSPEDHPITVDLKDRSDQYIQNGLYNKSGQLLKNKSPAFNSISFIEPITIQETNRSGLKSFQHITDSISSKPIGTIETTWSYSHDHWIIVTTKWVPN